VDALERFHFNESALDSPGRSQIVDQITLRRPARYRFTGDIWGYPEGEGYFPGSPLLVVESTFAEAIVLETLIQPANPQPRFSHRRGLIPDHGGRGRPAVHGDGLAAYP